MTYQKRVEVQKSMDPKNLHNIGLRSRVVAQLLAEYVRLIKEQWPHFSNSEPYGMLCATASQPDTSSP